MKRQIVKTALIVALVYRAVLVGVLCARNAHAMPYPPPKPTIGAPVTWPPVLFLPIVMR